MTEQQPVRIGELFPSDDLIGQWVFGLSVVVDDMRVVTKAMKTANDEQDLRGMLFHYRGLIVRLYEAGRLIVILDQHPEVAAFAEKFSMDGLRFLRSAYLPADSSTVAELYAELRHRTVHLSWVGGAEMQRILEASAWLPARLIVEHRREVIPQWVQAVSATSLFGDMTRQDWCERYQERSRVAADIASSWMMMFSLASVGHVHRRGIDFERLVELDDDATQGPPAPAA